MTYSKYEVLENDCVIFTGTASELAKLFNIAIQTISFYARKKHLLQKRYKIQVKEEGTFSKKMKEIKENGFNNFLQSKVLREDYEMNGIQMTLIYGVSGNLVKTIFHPQKAV